MDSADCKHEIKLFGKATSGKDEIPDGEDPYAVGRYAVHYVRGLQDEQILRTQQVSALPEKTPFFWHQDRTTQS